MRLKSQYIFSISVFGILLLFISASIIFTNQQVAQINDQEQLASNIQSGASNLGYVSNDYFLFQQNEQLALWQSQYSSLSDDVAKLNPTTPEQIALTKNVAADLQRLNSVFNSSVAFIERAPRNQSLRVIPEFQTVWSRLGVQNQALASDSSFLKKNFDDQAEQIKQKNNSLIFALLGAFGAYFVVSYFIVYKRTFSSIKKLRDGTKIVGSGNLDFSIAAKSNDEVGELSQAFNQMTANLKNVTASKTDLEQAQASLGESERRLRFHAENIPLAVVEWDRNFVVTRWAGDAQKIFGWSASETIGKLLMDLHMIYEPDVPIVEKTMGRLTSGETKVVSSNRNITKKGKVIFCTWYNSVLLDEKGKMVSVFSFVEDNTARVDAEKALEENNKNLETIVEERTKQLKDSERLAAIGATAGMVGHDIRNPLQGIINDVYLAKQDLASTAESEEKKNALESLTEIEKNVVYIDKIVADLQDFARPIQPVVKAVDLEQICDEVLLKSGFPKNVDASYHIDKDARQLMADPDLLKRVIINLVINAVQAMPEGGKLELRSYRDEDEVVIEVQDTGVGIPDGAKEKLFTPLFTTKSKGQGFGLAVVKRVTESMNGTVTFKSQTGKGTTFIIRLPAKKLNSK